MNQKLKYGSIFTSVDNPEKFSQTWESITKVIGFGLTLVLSIKGVDSAIASQTITSVLTAYTALGGAIVLSWQAGNALFGAFRKVVAVWHS